MLSFAEWPVILEKIPLKQNIFKQFKPSFLKFFAHQTVIVIDFDAAI